MAAGRLVSRVWSGHQLFEKLEISKTKNPWLLNILIENIILHKFYKVENLEKQIGKLSNTQNSTRKSYN